MGFPFAKPGDSDYVDNSSAKDAPQPAKSAPASPNPVAPNRTQNLHPRSVHPFSTTKLVPKTASATTLLKIAHFKAARTWGEYMFGNGISSAFDPNQRGMAVDMAAYSNPISGTIFGVNDTARHLYNGNWGNAAGSLGMMGLSFLPGAGAAGAAARGGMAAAKGVAGAAAKGGVKALAAPAAQTAAKSVMGRAGQAVGTAGKAVGKAFNTVSSVTGAPFAPKSFISNAANIPNHVARFGHHSGIQGVRNTAAGMHRYARTGQRLMEKTPALRYPAMATAYDLNPFAPHSYGVNPTGESTTDINNRLDTERSNLQQELRQMGYGAGY